MHLWDLATGALIQTLEGHTGWVHSVTFSPNGSLLASGSYDRTVCLWDLATGVLTQRLKSHRETWNVEHIVNTLQFSHDGVYLHTNFGAFDIQSRRDSPTYHEPCANVDVSLQDNQLIKLNGRQALWLPVEARPSCFKINDNLLALGHASGRISFVRFNT